MNLSAVPRQKRILFCIYALFALLLLFGQTGFRAVNAGAVFYFFCMLLFALVSLAVKGAKRSFLAGVLAGVLPYLAFCAARRVFFGAFNDGALCFGVYSLSAALLALTGLCVEFVSLLIKLVQKKRERPSRESLISSAKSVLLLAELSAFAFFASKLAGWGIARFFWSRADYEFWNDTAVIEYGAGYSFKSVAADFRLLSLFPLFFFALLGVKEKVLARFSPCLRCLALLLLGIFMFASSAVFGWEAPCAWNPLEDTRHAASFNPKNVPLLQIGQTKEEVAALVGEPLYALKDGAAVPLKEADTFHYTGDAASFWADFGWYELSVQFGADGRLSKITSRWMDD